MVRPVIIFLISILMVSCESDKKDNLRIQDGTYTGTFQRQIAFGGGGDIVNVSLTFSSDTWTGQSERNKYPALCHGKYELIDQKIVFTNECAWTAEFDWSLILGGEYDFNIDGKLLTIIRDYCEPSTDTYIDKYILTKQE